jgi:hypothetical protein
MPAEIYRTNYLFSGVVIPSEHHRVVFAYDQTQFRIAGGLSLLALLVLLGLGVRALKRVEGLHHQAIYPKGALLRFAIRNRSRVPVGVRRVRKFNNRDSRQNTGRCNAPTPAVIGRQPTVVREGPFFKSDSLGLSSTNENYQKAFSSASR